MTTAAKVDVALVGGGLANGLIAYRLSRARPSLTLRVIERRGRLGGDHVWSFHDADLSPAQREWIAPLVERSWPGYEVRFPGLRRTFSSGYNSITSSRFDERLRAELGDSLLLGRVVADISPDGVGLADGTRLAARAVIDGRGPVDGPLRLAFQKFVGLHLELETAHDLAVPILMDATVEQRDGFRFLYTLPFGETRLLVEDTRYSDTADLDRGEMRRAVERYARRMGWRVSRVVEQEEGVLPIVLGGDIERFWAEGLAGVARAGLRAGLFHPTTGYSLPEAVRLADRIAASETLSGGELLSMTRARSTANWSRHAYFRLLNRMLFQAAEPAERWRVMERFYRLREPLIERFYADRLTLGDRIRVLSGKPPVSPLRALSCLRDAEPHPSAGAIAP